VSRKAETAPAAHLGRYSCFCSGVPNIRTGSGTPIDWCDESSAPRLGWTVLISMSARP